MLGCDVQECIDPVAVAVRVLLPNQVVQKHAHGVHAEALSPSQFSIDALGIEAVFLPHFELINRGGWDVVTADEPGLPLIPGIRLSFCPARLCRAGAQKKAEEERELLHCYAGNRLVIHNFNVTCMRDTRQNPWTVLKTRPVYENAWMRVREDQVIRPDGRPGIYGVVEIPQSIAVLALDENDCVLLIGQWRYTRDKYSWELPVGSSHSTDPDLQACAVRELREEAGVEAREWGCLGKLEASIGVTTDTQWMFLAKDLIKGQSAPDPEELLEIRWVPFADAVKMVLEDEICESASVAAILKLDARRRPGLV